MRRVAVVLLSTLMATPVASFAATQRGDRDDRRDNREEHRVYDRAHRDYHVWNDSEDRVFREYVETHHLRARTYSELSRKQQRHYWNWRHERERERQRERK